MAAADSSGQAKLIDGKEIAATIRSEIKVEVDKLKEATGKVPGLAVVLVGTRGDSETYVRSKRKACEEVGIASFDADLPEDVSEEEVLKVVKEFNSNPDIHGILVQLPLPKHMDSYKVTDAISPEKDVDGFHPANIGALAMRDRTPLFVPCTPKGCLELLKRSGIQISGRNACIIGRSNIVGTPMAMLLQRHDATVSVVHSRTADPAPIVSRADIVVAAVGNAEMVRAAWVKPGAAVLDVGTNPVEDASKKRGYRLVGDVAFEEVRQKAGHITPVPGGVGPMTIAMLLKNCLESAQRILQG
ncbi:hypothetical protein WJX73_009858 [Symbiochloris irregularis]|uniref:Methenyltetrahydrofolate cyclohydrolase n=1 Tax=Symbiochloris irregularis TaxID=706552 RepID=A0AAW1PVQ9_9CHLO